MFRMAKRVRRGRRASVARLPVIP